MRILFNIGHPAQVHQFKNVIWNLESKGHECKITTIAKDVSLDLLDAYDLDYEVVGDAKTGLFSKATELIKIERRLYNISKKFHPDLLVGGSGNAYVAHVGKILRKPSIVFEDSENAKIEHLLTFPFATTICTPSSFTKNLGDKHVLCDGYKELAYLHPNYFHPDPSVLDELGLKQDDNIIVLRFVTWNADHDIGHRGIQNKVEIVKKLEKFGHVIITSEEELDPELEEYKVKVSPDKLHNLLYYAQLLMGDSQTMTTEAAVLGVPAIRCNSFVGINDMSNFIELEEKYNLIFNFNNSEDAFNKAVEILESTDLKKEWAARRDSMLNEKMDVSSFMTWFIEEYPQSFEQMKTNLNHQYNFK